MSERSENQRWMEEGAEQSPDGWEAQMIDLYGMEGALDLLAAQGSRPYEINLTHRPFAGNEELKGLVRAARDALSELASGSYSLWWDQLERVRAEKRAADRTDGGHE